jgi:hypothetical protein
MESNNPWGTANPRRGLNHYELALKFIPKFPLGTLIANEDFDQWGYEVGELGPVSEETQIGSPEWVFHVQQRNQLRSNLNNGGMHPRLLEAGATPFSLEYHSPGIFIVRSPKDLMKDDKFFLAVKSLMENLVKRSSHNFQSIDWNQYSSLVRMIAKDRHQGIKDLEKNIISQIEQHARRVASMDEIFTADTEPPMLKRPYSQEDLPFNGKATEESKDDSDIEI